MRSKRYPTDEKLLAARRAHANMTRALGSLVAATLELRFAGDERAAHGVERAALRVGSWRDKVRDSARQSAEVRHG